MAAMSPTEQQFSRALDHMQKGRGSQAREICRRIIAENPRFAPAHALLGVLALGEHDADEAAERFFDAVDLQPDQPEHRLNLGVALVTAGRRDDAVASLAAATLAFPHHADLWSLLGNAHAGRRDWTRAEQAFARATVLAPSAGRHHYNRALACDRAGRLSEALHHYEAALEREPALHEARNNRALVLMGQGRLAEATEEFARTANEGHHAGATINLGRALGTAGRSEEALAVLQVACERFPETADAHHYLGELLDARGAHDAALRAYTRTLGLDPGHRAARAAVVHAARFVAAFDTVERHETTAVADALADAARNERPSLTPFMAMACAMDAAQEAAIARATAAHIAPDAAVRPPLWSTVPDRAPSGGRVRIGYLSGDFRDQATAHLAVGLFENHDRDRFEIVAFSHSPALTDAYRARIEQSVDALVEVGGLDHDAAAREIACRGIDLLVDLKGHTRDNRLAVFARRPAPVQVTYLGFPGTTGARWMDWLIADPIVAPPGIAEHWSERVIRLEGCYQANDNSAPVADSPARREEVGLPVDAMVYACLNEPWKIDRASFALWCRILGAVPDSVLWLRDGGETFVANIRAEAGRHGIAPDRIVLAPMLPKPHHLARLRLADLFLDSLVVNAHTTATDALWAGLPLVTIPGDRFPARVATSLLHAAGLGDLAAPDGEAYVSLAVSLGLDRDRRAQVRARTAAARTSRLFDSAATSRALEAAYLTCLERLDMKTS